MASATSLSTSAGNGAGTTKRTTASSSSSSSSLFMPDDTNIEHLPKLVACDLFSNNEEVVLAALVELANICYDNERHHELKRIENDFITKEEVKEYKAKISALEEEEANVRMAIRDYGGHLAFYALLQHSYWVKHDYLNIIIATLRCIHDCSYPKDMNTEAFHDLIIHLGILETLLSLVTKHERNDQIQLWGMRCFVHLCWYDRNYEVFIFDHDGIRHVVNSMNQFPMDADIQRVCCYFLYKMIQDEIDAGGNGNDVCECIVKAGGQRVILAAIENHPEIDHANNDTSSTIHTDYDDYQYSNIQKNARNTMKALMEGPPVSAKPPRDDTNRRTAATAPAPAPPSALDLDSKTMPSVKPSSRAKSSKSAATVKEEDTNATSSSIGSLFKKMNLF